MTGDAAKSLSDFIDPNHVLDLKEKLPRQPLIILAFDEAHLLTNNPSNEPWTFFSELHRILHQTSDQPIFSLFISTAGRFQLFSPSTGSDPSAWIRGSTLLPLDPIMEIHFDVLAHKAKENTVMLDMVMSMDWMSHLGCPLYVQFGYALASSLLPMAE